MLIRESHAISYEIKNASRRMRTSRENVACCKRPRSARECALHILCYNERRKAMNANLEQIKQEII